MNKQQDLNNGIKKLLNKILSNYTLGLNAEEIPKEETQQKDSVQINYEDLVRKAREEEKAKLYPLIEKLKEEKKTLVEKHNNALLTIGQKDEEIEALTKDLASVKKEGSRVESEEIAKLKEQIATLESNTVDVEAIKKSVADEYELKLYRMEKLHEVGNKVIPELVTGSTKEEIDASIKASVERYNSILNSNNSNQTQNPTTKPTIQTGTPVDTFSLNNLNVEDIANMTPQQWAEYRTKLGMK